MQKNISDTELLKELKNNHAPALELLFNKYYRLVCDAVYRILEDPVVTEDIAQEVFYEVWKKRNSLNISSSFKAYLRRAGVNKALNVIRDNKFKYASDDALMTVSGSNVIVQEKLEAEELDKHITSLIDSLPKKRKVIFMLSRFEEMTYKEIAAHLDISVKTVENQMSQALKYLRIHLKEYLQ